MGQWTPTGGPLTSRVTLCCTRTHVLTHTSRQTNTEMSIRCAFVILIKMCNKQELNSTTKMKNVNWRNPAILFFTLEQTVFYSALDSFPILNVMYCLRGRVLILHFVNTVDMIETFCLCSLPNNWQLASPSCLCLVLFHFLFTCLPRTLQKPASARLRPVPVSSHILSAADH